MPSSRGIRARSPTFPRPALRAVAASGDLAAVVAPPYDVIDPETRARLVARHPANVVRLDLPVEELGDGPDDRYRRAARTLATWRSDGTLRKDPHPSDVRLRAALSRARDGHASGSSAGSSLGSRLEAYGPESGVLPHERTLSGPKEDRYKLLRATGVNTSPVVVLFDDAVRWHRGAARGGRRRARPTSTSPTTTASAIGCGHCRRRATGRRASSPEHCSAAAGAGPITIADGHHRYETALRYRDERRMTRSCDEDPPFDYVLALMLEATRPGPHGAADPPARARDRRGRRGRAARPRARAVRRRTGRVVR